MTELTTMQLASIMFVVLLPCCAYFSFKRGFINGANMMLGELAMRDHLTPNARKLFHVDDKNPFEDPSPGE